MGTEIGSKRFLNFLIKAWCHHHIRVRKKRKKRVEDNVSEDLESSAPWGNNWYHDWGETVKTK